MNNFVINTKELSKEYGRQYAVKQVDLHIQPGHIYGLLGRNGAGKTTIMKMLLGLVKPTSGQIQIFNEEFPKQAKTILPRIGSLIEAPGFYSHLSARENLEVFARIRGTVSANAIQGALDTVNLAYSDKKSFAHFSLGMKQRLGIANAILNDPELLILDEPTNGLDPIGIAEVRQFIRDLCRQQGKTVMISSHILSEIALIADDIGIIHEGRLLVEKSLSQLQKENGKCLLVKLSSVDAACRVLEQQLRISDYHVEPEGYIRIYDLTHPPEAINKTLVENGIWVSQLHSCDDSLEDYFKRITGGEGIA